MKKTMEKGKIRKVAELLFSDVMKLNTRDKLKMIWMVTAWILVSGITGDTKAVVIAVLAVNLICSLLSLLTIEVPDVDDE